MASFVRWLKTRTSGRGRSKERSNSKASEPAKELPHPASCGTSKQDECNISGQSIPDILVNSGSTGDLTSLHDEELLNLQRNAPLRRTLPPIPLDQSPYKPGLSNPEEIRRPRSNSAHPGCHSPRPAPVYEEIEDEEPKTQCAPYLVVAVPNPNTEPLRDSKQSRDHSPCPMHGHDQMYAYRYSCHLQSPEKYSNTLRTPSPNNRSPGNVINRDAYTLPGHMRKSKSPAGDQDSVDSCYEYDMDSSYGHSSDFTFSPGSRDGEEDSDAMSGVYPLSKGKGQSSRSQSNTSNETYNEYDTRSSERSYHDGRSIRHEDMMMTHNHVKPYGMTTLCPDFDDFHETSPRYHRKISSPIHPHHDPSVVFQHHSPFFSPQVQRKHYERSQSYDPCIGSAHQMPQHYPAENLFAKPQCQQSVDRCRECGSYPQEPSKQDLFDIAEDMHSPLPGRAQRPRPTLGVSAMCYRKNQPRSRFSHDFELQRRPQQQTPNLTSRYHEIHAKYCDTPRSYCDSQVHPARYCENPNLHSTPQAKPRAMSAGVSRSSRPVITMDLPDEKDKFSIRVTLAHDSQGHDDMRLRQAAASQMQQARMVQSKNNRLLQDLMQVNFEKAERHHLATAMS